MPRVDPPGVGWELQAGTRRLGMGGTEGITHHKRGTREAGSQESRHPVLPRGGVHEEAPVGPGVEKGRVFLKREEGATFGRTVSQASPRRV